MTIATYFKVLLSLKNFNVSSVKSSCMSHTRMHCGPVFSLKYVQLHALFIRTARKRYTWLWGRQPSIYHRTHGL